MAGVWISKLSQYVGQCVTIKGWVHQRRSSGSILFLQLRDGTGFVQGVVSKAEAGEELFGLATSLTQETSVMVEGDVRGDARAPGGVELLIRAVQVVHPTHDYPITPKEHGIDFLLDHRHLWLRAPRQRAILKIRAEIVKAIREYLDTLEFTQVDAPILTPSSCEGTTDLFETKYFSEAAYLTQSGQLYMEAAAMALGRVYSFGPVFRAEKSKTRRHLIEFWMIEPEMAYVEHDESLHIQEEMVVYVVAHVLRACREELRVLGRDVSSLERVALPFPRLAYDDAVKLLREKGREIEWGADFGAADETEIASAFDRPVFVEKYPTTIKAFYMKPDPHRPEVVLCADLLAPEGYGEIIGGSQRIDDPELLQERFAQHGLSQDDYAWYLDLRRYGSVPHSGFGLGLERTVAWICGLDHVRETSPFPRLLYRLKP